MHRVLALAILLMVPPFLLAGDVDPKSDWPVWRGPTGNGIAEPTQSLPLAWSKTENVAWKASVPGRGHGSATVVGNRVFLQTADEDKDIQWVLCFDRSTGKELWRKDVHASGLDRKGNKKASQ